MQDRKEIAIEVKWSSMVGILNKILKSGDKVCVGMAGPGTGKSHTFGEIIKSSEYKNRKILILSFIKKLVDDLKEEFKEFDNVEVGTLHAFALNRLKFSNNTINLAGSLDEILSEDLQLLEGEEYDYTKQFQKNEIDQQKENFYKNRKFFYEKRDVKLYSFNSVVYALNKAFEERGNNIPEYDLVLIDEFQDFNPLECRLVELLASKNKTVIVGDDDQALYGFKNATPEIIRNFYNDEKTENFTLRYCYRCTKVIVDTVGDVIEIAKNKGFLRGRINKEYKYPDRVGKDEVSEKNPFIEYKQGIKGNQLFCFLSDKIKQDVDKQGDKRVLVLISKEMIRYLTIGLMKSGINVMGVELFGQKDEVNGLLKSFNVLRERKTDDFALRCVLHKYLDEEQLKSVIQKSNNDNKKIWGCLDEGAKKKIEGDIALYKECTKVVKNKATREQKNQFIERFGINIHLSSILSGVGVMSKGAVEAEIMTPMNSKGLSAHHVYYFVDDRYTTENNELSDTKICEFIVGITRAKEKLILISTEDRMPQILNFAKQERIKNI